MRILIIDDFKLNGEYLAKLFSPIANCDQVESGKAALLIFSEALKSKKNYDLVCLDLMMPGLDGFEVLKQLRLLEKETGQQDLKKAKILITSALKDGNSVTRAIQLGCDGYLAKPYTRKNLHMQLEKLKLL